MKAECIIPAAHTVLLVAADSRALLLAQAILAGKGHHVLVANNSRIAIIILRHDRVPVDSVAIQADLKGCDKLRSWALRVGARPWTLHPRVNNESVMLEGLESGADWESAATLVA